MVWYSFQECQRILKRLTVSRPKIRAKLRDVLAREFINQFAAVAEQGDFQFVAGGVHYCKATLDVVDLIKDT